jgi:hypothetical protein
MECSFFDTDPRIEILTGGRSGFRARSNSGKTRLNRKMESRLAKNNRVKPLFKPVVMFL